MVHGVSYMRLRLSGVSCAGQSMVRKPSFWSISFQHVILLHHFLQPPLVRQNGGLENEVDGNNPPGDIGQFMLRKMLFGPWCFTHALEAKWRFMRWSIYVNETAILVNFVPTCNSIAPFFATPPGPRKWWPRKRGRWQ